VLCVTGRGAAALFAGEPGGHRWQRVPPTEKRGRVQTSTVTVAVLATPARVDLAIREEDVDVETMRGSGAGGQHRNKTDSAVRARHRPTGIEVRCESERSQHRNRELALQVLAARVVDRDRAASDGARAADRRRQVGSGMRADKRRTIRVQDDQVTDHDGRTWRFKAYARGDW
jgi:peptide chain release factor 1